jgi:hypothetical protein
MKTYRISQHRSTGKVFYRGNIIFYNFDSSKKHGKDNHTGIKFLKSGSRKAYAEISMQ